MLNISRIRKIHNNMLHALSLLQKNVFTFGRGFQRDALSSLAAAIRKRGGM